MEAVSLSLSLLGIIVALCMLHAKLSELVTVLRERNHDSKILYDQAFRQADSCVDDIVRAIRSK